MDAIWELVKALIMLVALFGVLLLIPFLFMTVFSFATSIDENLDLEERDQQR